MKSLCIPKSTTVFIRLSVGNLFFRIQLNRFHMLYLEQSMPFRKYLKKNDSCIIRVRHPFYDKNKQVWSCVTVYVRRIQQYRFVPTVENSLIVGPTHPKIPTHLTAHIHSLAFTLSFVKSSSYLVSKLCLFYHLYPRTIMYIHCKLLILLIYVHFSFPTFTHKSINAYLIPLSLSIT